MTGFRVIQRTLHAVLLAAGAILATAHAPAYSQVLADIERSQSELSDTRQRIREVEQIIAEIEATRSDAAKRLAQAERAVSTAHRKLRKLTGDLKAAGEALATRQAEQSEVEARIASRQTELSSWLKRHYMYGASDVAPFLLARDPNQLARDAHYLERLGRARLMLIESLREDLRERERVVHEVATRRDQLLRLTAEQRRQSAELEKAKAERGRILAGLERRLQAQQEELDALRHNERQLGRVVDALIRQAAARRQAEQATSDRPQGQQARAGSEGAGELTTGVRFADLQGKMPLPVQGELIGRFGAPRAEGGTRWRGIFIGADGGQDVRAVAAGEVVFSDWLRGYGNLVILDHGDDYLTVYGNNDSLFGLVGDRIPAGAAIATVGASGGASRSGLYFEVRHQGEPVDPLRWVVTR